MWLEVNVENQIVGVHSERCQSENEWVDIENTYANPGDFYIDGEVVSALAHIQNTTPTLAKNIEDEERRKKAYITITTYFPEWEQLNILRINHWETVQAMGNFIDEVREWSNGSEDDTALENIISKHIPQD